MHRLSVLLDPHPLLDTLIIVLAGGGGLFQTLACALAAAILSIKSGHCGPCLGHIPFRLLLHTLCGATPKDGPECAVNTESGDPCGHRGLTA